MTQEQVLQDVEKTSIQLMLKETFYGHFFSNLIKECVPDDHQVQTAAICLNSTTNTLSLLINRKFWAEELKGVDTAQGKLLKYGIIKHEILHILFKHIFQYDKFTNKSIGNIAVDLVVNQCIKLEQLPMQDSICLLKNFPEFFPDTGDNGKDVHQTSEYYYRRLIEEAAKVRETLQEGAAQQQQQGGSGGGEGDGQGSGDQGDESDDDQNDDSNEGDGQGDGDGEEEKEGQGQGSNITDNPNWDKLNKAQKHLARFLDDERNQKMHSTWKELSNMKQGKKEFVEQWIDTTMQETVKRCDRGKEAGKWRGHMPGSLLEYIDELIAGLTPSVNWKKMLRSFAANGENTYIVPTLKRRSKRYGTFPGHKIKKEIKMMVAIDTSGSVCNASLGEFFAEIHHIWKTDAEIKIVEADYNIGNIWDYTGVPPTQISGRGGTSFNEPIIYANEEYKPDCVVYFTDGEAPSPPKCNCPLMWIISKNQGVQVEDIADFQGIKIKMDF